jgi:hypothetical protein
MKRRAAGEKTKAAKANGAGKPAGASTGRKKAEKLAWEKFPVHHRVKQASKGQNP